MFRTVDVHGNISNPSPVFQVEIVDDRQSIYFLNTVFEFPKKMTNLNSISMKKYLQISPAYLQGILKHSGVDEKQQANTLLQEVQLGIRDEKTGGKRCKIRFTSRQTGRKIDLNVDFKLKRVDQNEEYVQDVNSLTVPNK